MLDYKVSCAHESKFEIASPLTRNDLREQSLRVRHWRTPKADDVAVKVRLDNLFIFWHNFGAPDSTRISDDQGD